MRIPDLIASALGIGISALFYWGTFFFPKSPVPIAGPRFFPQLLCICLLIACILLGIQALLHRKKINSESKKSINAEARSSVLSIKVFAAIVCSFLYILGLNEFGYAITTFCLVFLLMLLMQQRRKIVRAFLWSAGISGGSYVIFAILLNASLPIGAIFR